MRAMQAMARNEGASSSEVKAAAPFSDLMSQSIDQVNNSMQASRILPLGLRPGTLQSLLLR